MRGNGYSNESKQCASGSGWLSGLFSLIGGVGIGAGLLYLLDPDKGQKRRSQIMHGAADLASSAKDYAGDALSSVGSKVGHALGAARDFAGEKLSGVGDYASSKLSGVSGYASDRMDDVKAYAQKQVFGETRAEHRVGVTICALSSMALGAALMYAFDPQAGRGRRRYVRDKASELASQAGDYAKQAGEAIKSGVDKVRDKVSSQPASNMSSVSSMPSSGNSMNSTSSSGIGTTL